MQISTERLKLYQSLYKARFGVDIPEKDAAVQAAALLRLVNTMKRTYAKPGNKTSSAG
jgi:hypothetical protein